MSDSSAGDPFASFLYPFLEDQGTGSLDSVMADVRASTVQKAVEVAAMRRAFWRSQGEALVAAARAVAGSLAEGGQLLVMGNGGSATDAQDMAADFLRAGWPALSLTNDIGVVTAVGNDVGFDNVYTRQVIAYGRAGDVLVGFSTSGQSPNLVSAFKQGRKMGLVTLGVAGYDGGRMAQLGLDHCLVVDSTYIPRIQEVHATIYHTLLLLVEAIIKEEIE